MSQLPYEYECPIDYALIKACSVISPLFHALHHTPNIITLEGAVSAIYSLHLLKSHKLGQFAFFHFFSYFLDCLDGFFARKYNMVSRFGEYFEHSKDVLATTAYFYILISNYYITIPVITVFSIAGLGCIVHMGHQQKYLQSKGGVLDPLQKLVVNLHHIKYTRWLGCGTFMLLSITVPFFLTHKFL